ncbi:fungal-specific transcription factor domain-containing protein [Xylariomycetidae sp. FL2044]|nr:fungal-specific transcription factor domain-containing protein [Xylariomycetidae sp. FL2044]
METLQGCDTCRSRHIRCDKRKPGCAQCARKGTQCPGYEAKYKWVVGPSVRKLWVPEESTPPHKNLVANINVNGNKKGTNTGWDDDAHVSTADKSPAPTFTISTFGLELYEQRRQQCFLDHYFDRTAKLMTITEDVVNPFGDYLKPFVHGSQALHFTLLAIAALHVSNCNTDQDVEAHAWRYRAMALSSLQKDLKQHSGSLETLVAVLFLGMTESWFNAENSGSVHLVAAKHLLLHRAQAGSSLPLFLVHWLYWGETLASFVSDNDGVLFASRDTYARLAAGSDSSHGTSTSLDPLVGTWGTLIPLVGRVGVIVRRRMRYKSSEEELRELINDTEVDLLQWQHPGPHLPDPPGPLPSPTTVKTQELDSMAEAYRLSALLTLYHYCPTLLQKRATLIPEAITASEFLLKFASSVVILLRQIPRDSRLWRVCALPILSAGQLVKDSSDREFLRSIMIMLDTEVQMSSVNQVSKLLEDVWDRRDSGCDVFWMDLLEEAGNPILVN